MSNYTEEEIVTRVNNVISRQLDVGLREIIPEALLIDDLSADSRGLVGLQIALEKEFNFFVLQEDEENLKTVQDLYDYVTAHA